MKIIITESQSRLLKENFPISLRRRLNYEGLKGHLDFINEYHSPCDYGSLGDFIGEVCDTMVVELIEDYYENGNDGSITNEIKDDLYYFMVDNFAGYLQEIYNKECN